MSANHFRKRRKESGFCSRVSMMATGSGVRSCVPPRSATTGSSGGGTGVAVGDHARGDGIRVRLRGMEALKSDLFLLEVPKSHFSRNRPFALELLLESCERRFQLPLFAGALVRC